MTKRARFAPTDKLDRYYTPRWPVVLLFEYLREHVPDFSSEDIIAEPCAGRGDMVRVFEEFGHSVVAGDIDPATWFPPIDATSPRALEFYDEADWIITNPPYNADSGTATEVIRNLLELGQPLAALVRITWIEPCNDRQDIFSGTFICDEYPVARPSSIGVLPRIQYSSPDAETSSNPATSAWFLWVPRDESDTTLWWWTKDDRDRVRQ